MKKQYMGVCDTETLGLYDDAAIASVGLTVFELGTTVPSIEALRMNGFYAEFNWKHQIEELGRKTTPSVLEWWKSQSIQARHTLLSPHTKSRIETLPILLEDYFTGLGLNPKHIMWFDRKSFDFFKLQHLYEVTLGVKEKYFVNPKNQYEIRTALTMLGFDAYGGMPDEDPRWFGLVKHNAQDDCIMDHIRVHTAMVKE